MPVHTKKPLFGTIAITCLLATAGCGTQVTPLTQAALDGEPFTVEQVLGDSVASAYAFCPYASKELGEQLGFNADDFYGIDDNPQAWETETGIGVLFEDGSSQVEWFDPREVSACEGRMQTGTEIDAGSPITVHKESREFANGTTSEVAVLKY
ncbi:Uncharacterised protein [Corynebacterium renale]|uniref:hypothetical protein n=1 Tax=Corynebacterium renale TaxID=1724 RepID=UPI000DA3E984|nr:hypothetical protein [Corynebacterium renale]SQG63972.1 Uncharacterised protein [Corynebacterium renale]